MERTFLSVTFDSFCLWAVIPKSPRFHKRGKASPIHRTLCHPTAEPAAIPTRTFRIVSR